MLLTVIRNEAFVLPQGDIKLLATTQAGHSNFAPTRWQYRWQYTWEEWATLLNRISRIMLQRVVARGRLGKLGRQETPRIGLSKPT